MIRKLRNLDSKSVQLLILAVSMVTIIFAASQQPASEKLNQVHTVIHQLARKLLVAEDRKDIDQTSGLYPCNDGTQKVHWKFCKDATQKNNDNTKTKTIVKVVPSNIDVSTGAPCSDGFVMNIKQVCVNKVFCEQTPTASGCKFNNTPAPVSQAIPPTNDPSRTSFDLVSCKYFGAQDAMNIKQMDYSLYLKCDNYPKTGDNAYTSGYADVVNARNNSILPKP
jgi:hypothetical protein